MNTKVMIPTHDELQSLKTKIDDAKRLAEYKRLKEDPYAITYKAANTPTEFDGEMQLPDTKKVLKDHPAVSLSYCLTESAACFQLGT